jgi:ferredoxin
MSDIDVSTAGRTLAAHRRIEPRQCVVCGREMIGTSRRKYCGNTCMVRAYRRRQREKPDTPAS